MSSFVSLLILFAVGVIVVFVVAVAIDRGMHRDNVRSREDEDARR